MSLIKKINVDKYFAERRAMRLGRVGLMSRTDAIGIEPTGKARNAARSTGNLTLGSVSDSASAPSIPIASDAGSSEDPK
jgi:hypothetical protein